MRDRSFLKKVEAWSLSLNFNTYDSASPLAPTVLSDKCFSDVAWHDDSFHKGMFRITLCTVSRRWTNRILLLLVGSIDCKTLRGPTPNSCHRCLDEDDGDEDVFVFVVSVVVVVVVDLEEDVSSVAVVVVVAVVVAGVVVAAASAAVVETDDWTTF